MVNRILKNSYLTKYMLWCREFDATSWRLVVFLNLYLVEKMPLLALKKKSLFWINFIKKIKILNFKIWPTWTNANRSVTMPIMEWTKLFVDSGLIQLHSLYAKAKIKAITDNIGTLIIIIRCITNQNCSFEIKIFGKINLKYPWLFDVF